MASHVWDAHREEDLPTRPSAAGLNATPGNHAMGGHGMGRPTGYASYSDEAASRVESNHQARLQSIKQAASQKKMILLNRIEELSVALQAQSKECAAPTEELDEYHRVFGPLGDFSARQVGLREEVVSLRDNVRQWQEKEQQARTEVKRLQRIIDGLDPDEEEVEAGAGPEKC